MPWLLIVFGSDNRIVFLVKKNSGTSTGMSEETSAVRSAASRFASARPASPSAVSIANKDHDHLTFEKFLRPGLGLKAWSFLLAFEGCFLWCWKVSSCCLIGFLNLFLNNFSPFWVRFCQPPYASPSNSKSWSGCSLGYQGDILRWPNSMRCSISNPCRRPSCSVNRPFVAFGGCLRPSRLLRKKKKKTSMIFF